MVKVLPQQEVVTTPSLKEQGEVDMELTESYSCGRGLHSNRCGFL